MNWDKRIIYLWEYALAKAIRYRNALERPWDRWAEIKAAIPKKREAQLSSIRGYKPRHFESWGAWAHIQAHEYLRRRKDRIDKWSSWASTGVATVKRRGFEYARKSATA